jgi:serine/threonine protein kinase
MQSSLLDTDIAGYRIEEKLGEGGMGTVYRALETNLGRHVALKLLHPGLARDPSIVERFRSEARAQANLNHPNVTTLYAFVLHDENAMIAMEYIKGETLREMVKRRGPIPAAEALALFRQVLAGVGAAHRMGIVHRDIKPSNLMLNDSGIVKVMDFGIAKITGNNTLTRTGLHLGTLYYMSPEQVKGEPVDVRSDIYALGITLYQMVTARVPFEGDSEFKIMSDHVNTAPPVPTSLCPAVPEPIERAILKALEKNPAGRFQSVEEFAAALTLEPGQEAAAVPAVPATAPAAAKSRSKWPWIASAAALLLIAAGSAAYFSFRPKPQLPLPPQPVSLAQVQPAAPPPLTPAQQPAQTVTPALHVSQPVVKARPHVMPVQPALAETTPPSAAVEPLSTPPAAPVAAPPPPVIPVPAAKLVVPAGTIFHVHMASQLDAASVHPGQLFAAVLDAPVNVGGQLAIAAGATVKGEVASIQREGHLHHSSKLLLALTELTTGGQTYPLHTPDTELSVPDARSGKVFGKISSVVSGIGRDIQEKDDKNAPASSTPGVHLQFQLSQPVSIAVH